MSSNNQRKPRASEMRGVNNKNTKSRIAPTPNQRPRDNAPVSIGNRTVQRKPRIVSRGENMIVSHSEYIGDITGSTSAFAVSRSIAMNPGIAVSFPWLNQIASRYESYIFKKLNYRFMTERPTTESGYISLIPDYDPTDPAPVDKTSAFQYESACKCAPWENMTQVSVPLNLHKRKSSFVRQGVLSASQDLALYDTGNLFVCVGGNSGSVNLGELWCDYEVEFLTPQLDSNYGSSDSGKLVATGSVSTVAPLGLAPVSTFSRGVLWTASSDGVTLTFPQNYQGLLSMVATGTGLTAIGLNSVLPPLPAQTTVDDFAANAAATKLLQTCRINALAGQQVSFFPAATSLTGLVLRFGQYQYSLA